MQKNIQPIAIFDSGVGGLTVLNAFLNLYPPAKYHQPYVYIGDTARLPYGTKSPETIIKYSETITASLLKFEPKAIIVACNTASTHALPAVAAMAGSIPSIGMIEPAVKAAIIASRNKHIAVIGTIGTINSKIYAGSITAINPNIKVTEIPCQLLVALAEENWTNTQIAHDVVRKYLGEVFNAPDAPDTLILGCTHFPLFESVLRAELGRDVTLINTGFEAAKTVSHLFSPADNAAAASVQCYVTDNKHRFEANMGRFLDTHEDSNITVDLLDL